VGLDAQERFAKMYEDRGVEDAIGIDSGTQYRNTPEAL
jgi:hypothetical protein